MKVRTLVLLGLVFLLLAAVVVLAIDNASLRRQLRSGGTERETRRGSRISNVCPVRPKCVPINSPSEPIPVRPAEESVTNDFETAFKARVRQLRADRAAARERRRERIRNLTAEEKLAQREAFVSRMRERSVKRMQAFVSKAGLNAEETTAFENTVSALGTSLGEAAEAWAETIRKTQSFNQDSKVKFIGDMSAILSAGYCEMDATLPETWKTTDGNVNLMEIVGPEALAPIVEALTENGLDDGLQTVGTVMGGPEGGEGGPGEGGPEGGEGGPGEGAGLGEGGPGTGGGPGGGPGGGFGGGPGGM